jgi:hypothetical protein
MVLKQNERYLTHCRPHGEDFMAGVFGEMQNVSHRWGAIVDIVLGRDVTGGSRHLLG